MMITHHRSSGRLHICEIRFAEDLAWGGGHKPNMLFSARGPIYHLRQCYIQSAGLCRQRGLPPFILHAQRLFCFNFVCFSLIFRFSHACGAQPVSGRIFERVLACPVGRFSRGQNRYFPTHNLRRDRSAEPFQTAGPAEWWPTAVVTSRQRDSARPSCWT